MDRPAQPISAAAATQAVSAQTPNRSNQQLLRSRLARSLRSAKIDQVLQDNTFHRVESRSLLPDLVSQAVAASGQAAKDLRARSVLTLRAVACRAQTAVRFTHASPAATGPCWLRAPRCSCGISADGCVCWLPRDSFDYADARGVSIRTQDDEIHTYPLPASEPSSAAVCAADRAVPLLAVSATRTLVRP